MEEFRLLSGRLERPEELQDSGLKTAASILEDVQAVVGSCLPSGWQAHTGELDDVFHNTTAQLRVLPSAA